MRGYPLAENQPRLTGQSNIVDNQHPASDLSPLCMSFEDHI